MACETEESARAVNSRLRAERRREKVMEELQSRGLGVGAEFMAEAIARWPGRWEQQLQFLFDAMLVPVRGRRSRHVVGAAQEAFHAEMVLVLRSLRSADVVIRDLSDLGRDEVLALIPFWLKKGYGAGTIQDKLSNLRRFFIVTGQPEVLPVHREFEVLLENAGIDPSRLVRAQVRPADYWLRRRQMGRCDGD